MGYKEFIPFTKLTAFDVNTFLMNQSVVVFPSATERNTAIPTPIEGMTVYLEDTNQLVVYTGSAWFPVAGQMPFYEAGKTADQTGITSSSETLVTWATPITNRGGFTVASNVVTVPLAGIYEIVCSIHWNQAISTGNNRMLRIYVNGTLTANENTIGTVTVSSSKKSMKIPGIKIAFYNDKQKPQNAAIWARPLKAYIKSLGIKTVNIDPIGLGKVKLFLSNAESE
jgi:hypothetical protein